MSTCVWPSSRSTGRHVSTSCGSRDRPGQQEVTGGTTRRTGPKDAFRVVWAISEFFLILFVFFMTTNHLTGILKLRMYLREATTKRTGPNATTITKTLPHSSHVDVCGHPAGRRVATSALAAVAGTGLDSRKLGEVRRGEWAQTTRNASFEPLVSFFKYYSCFL